MRQVPQGRSMKRYVVQWLSGDGWLDDVYFTEGSREKAEAFIETDRVRYSTLGYRIVRRNDEVVAEYPGQGGNDVQE